jgi:replicative DNA helicase
MVDFTAPEHELVAPTPLRPGRVLPSFPTAALPGWVAAWVRAEATATQTPEDLAAACALAVLSAAAGGRVIVEARPGWEEPTNTYHLPVMRPGSRKSAVVGHATRPLQAAERDLVASVRDEIAEATLTKDIARRRAEDAAKKAAKATGGDIDADTARRFAAAADAIEIPTEPRLIADDVTPEALASLLANYGGQLAIISAEGGIFDTMSGKYNGGIASFDVFLKAHAGDTLRVDRKGRPPEYVERPALTMLLTVQPAVLAVVASNPAFGGRGLTARWLYTLPVDNVGRRMIGAPPVPGGVRETYEDRVRALVAELVPWKEPCKLRLTPDAHEYLLEIERAVEPRLLTEGTYGPIREWASKLVGAVLRIAGLLHVAEDVVDTFRYPIERATLERASLIGGYYADHAVAAFDLIGDGGVGQASYVLAHLLKHETEEFSIKSLMNELPRGRFPDVESVATAVAVLEEHDLVLPQPMPEKKGPGRKPSPVFRVHPAAESAQSAEPTTHTRPAVGLVHSADSADSAAR